MVSWVWVLVLLGAVWLADWGADHLANPLRKIRQQWGITGTGGAAVLAIVTASPEVAINTTSALRGVGGIGLGNMLGSNIVSFPLIFTVAYLASRRQLRDNGGTTQQNSNRDSPSDGEDTHAVHLQQRLLRLEKRTVTVLALPYLGILALLSLLTLPEPWQGLQPIDGIIMLIAYGLYLGQAVYRGREEGESVEWSKRELGLAAAGVGALAVGAYFTVRATENLVAAFGISEVIGGLFITATMSTTPEVFKTWRVVKSGQITAGTTSVVADNAVTVTIGFLPLALVTVPIQNMQLFVVNLAFVALMPTALALLVHFGSVEHGLKRWQVGVLDGIYLLYLLVMVIGVLHLL
jgi:cation:H+ antiporter